MNGPRTLAVASLWGALLTVVILAMSVLLRLGTDVTAGEAVSTLPEALEQSARVAHRIAAMAVGILAALVLVAALRERPVPPQRRAALAGIVALTLLLAMIGRYTPGYRLDGVTVANVLGGVGLAAAFWWLRTLASPHAGRGDALAWVALGLLLALAAFGAAADAALMRGQNAFGPLHLWLAAIFLALALAVAWRQRARRLAATALGLFAIAQFTLGFAIAATRARPLAMAWVHAMIACAMALLLVGLAAGRQNPKT